jgi:hypothetical protein
MERTTSVQQTIWSLIKTCAKVNFTARKQGRISLQNEHISSVRPHDFFLVYAINFSRVILSSWYLLISSYYKLNYDIFCYHHFQHTVSPTENVPFDV